MIPPLDLSTGFLPVGRYAASIEDVEAMFLTNEHRRELWDEWCEVTTFLRDVLPVAAVWLAGSFLSTKPEPGDVDCVYVLERSLVEDLTDPHERMVIAAFAQGGVKALMGRRVDSYVIEWVSNATTAAAGASDYYGVRGWWDDFWGRCREPGADTQSLRLSSMPRRGYLEVMIDGFQPAGPVITT